MSFLLTGDLHLTDNPLDEYRWEFFNFLKDTVVSKSIDQVFILGDITDRKDKHSGNLVNRLVGKLKEITVPVTILMGNHDMPISGVPYLDFLNRIPKISYITKPEHRLTDAGEVVLLPFSGDPLLDWREVGFDSCSFIFMHQTVNGTKIEGDREITDMPYSLPLFPKDKLIFSGDIHRSQKIKFGENNILYLGAPYPVKFSESWHHYIVIYDKDGWYYIPTNCLNRYILDISSSEDFKGCWPAKKGDQVKIRYNLKPEGVSSWYLEEAKIHAWADKQEVILVSLETTLDGDKPSITLDPLSESKEAIFNEFCSTEGLTDGNLVSAGRLVMESVFFDRLGKPE